MTLVTILSLVSFSDPDITKIKIPGLDKLVHFTFYFVATISGCFFLRERTNGRYSIQKALVVFLIATISYGILIEVLQHQMEGARDGNVYDALANIFGSLVGLYTVIWLFSSKGLFKWKASR